MKYITYWSVRPGSMKEAARRFLAGEGQPPAGLKLLGRWHKADCSGGWTLTETNDPKTLYENAAFWSDVLEVYTHPVIEDDAAGPVLGMFYAPGKSRSAT